MSKQLIIPTHDQRFIVPANLWNGLQILWQILWGGKYAVNAQEIYMSEKLAERVAAIADKEQRRKINKQAIDKRVNDILNSKN